MYIAAYIQKQQLCISTRLRYLLTLFASVSQPLSEKVAGNRSNARNPTLLGALVIKGHPVEIRFIGHGICYATQVCQRGAFLLRAVAWFER